MAADIIDLHAPRIKPAPITTKAVPARKDLQPRLIEKSQPTIDALAELLSEAVAGNLIGVAIVCRYRGTDFGIVTAGEARRSPTFTRGALAYLDDQLAEFVREE